MAFLGDFGRIFLGGAKTGDVAAATTLALTGNPAAAATVGGTAQRAADALSGPTGSPDVATSPAQAGVDSPATLINVSQTGQLQPGGNMRGSGMQQQAGFGLVGPLSQLLGQGARTLARPGVGGAVTGFGAGLVGEFITDMFGNTKKLVITRKLQRDVKKVFMLSGGDVEFVSMNSLMLFGKDLSPDQILMILFKTFKNQGPFVTKAAVRKTRSTIRKMETLCDLKDRLAPPRRAAPRRRTMGSTTKVLQVK